MSGITGVHDSRTWIPKRVFYTNLQLDHKIEWLKGEGIKLQESFGESDCRLQQYAAACCTYIRVQLSIYVLVVYVIVSTEQPGMTGNSLSADPIKLTKDPSEFATMLDEEILLPAIEINVCELRIKRS